MSLSPHPRLVASLLLAGAGLVLFFGGDFEVLGLPLGWLGVWLVVAAAWCFVDAVHRVPRSEAELSIAPGEWQAWVGLGFTSAILVGMGLHAGAFAAPVPIGENASAHAAGRTIAMMFLAWAVLAAVLRQRWKGMVVEDERGARIARTARQWGRGAIAVAVVGFALLLGFSPTPRLQQFSYPLLAHLLIMALLAGVWFDHAVEAWLHWRDRRAAQA